MTRDIGLAIAGTERNGTESNDAARYIVCRGRVMSGHLPFLCTEYQRKVCGRHSWNGQHVFCDRKVHVSNSAALPKSGQGLARTNKDKKNFPSPTPYTLHTQLQLGRGSCKLIPS